MRRPKLWKSDSLWIRIKSLRLNLRMNFSEHLSTDRWATEWKITFAMIRVFGTAVRTERPNELETWGNILYVDFAQFEEKKLSAQSRKANTLKFKKKKKFIGTLVDSVAARSCIGINQAWALAETQGKDKKLGNLTLLLSLETLSTDLLEGCKFRFQLRMAKVSFSAAILFEQTFLFYSDLMS